MIWVDKVTKFVIYHIFNAFNWCADERIVEGKYVFFKITASPTGFHMPKFDLGIVGTILVEFWIYLAAAFLDKFTQKRIERTCQHSLSVIGAFQKKLDSVALNNRLIFAAYGSKNG
jgi:hypothetical protein